jgi:hypothetical protein
MNVSDEIRGDYALLCGQIAEKARLELERSQDTYGSALYGDGPLPASALASRAADQRRGEEQATREKLARWEARREVALEKGLFLIQPGDWFDFEMLKNDYIKGVKSAAVERTLIEYRA